MFEGGGVTGNRFSCGEAGGLGSFLWVLSGVFGRCGGLEIVDGAGGVCESKAAVVAEGTVLVGVRSRSGKDIPRPGSMSACVWLW
jgi:hypothetical protein